MSASIPLVKRAPRGAAGLTEQGDADARAKRLLTGHSADVLRYLARRTDLPEDSADLLAETMLVVWKRRASLPAVDGEARMWFFGIARRLLLRYYRGKSRSEELASALREHISLTIDVSDLDGRPPSPAEDLRALIANLPEVEQEIVTMVHWDGFNLTEIAEVMRVPASTVRSRYRRARAKLRVELES